MHNYYRHLLLISNIALNIIKSHIIFVADIAFNTWLGQFKQVPPLLQNTYPGARNPKPYLSLQFTET